ncbi:PDZ domain-containing protein [Collimonas fungivorans]|nr:PDZ domain-containing protein [Collimonas fungivorans]
MPVHVFLYISIAFALGACGSGDSIPSGQTVNSTPDSVAPSTTPPNTTPPGTTSPSTTPPVVTPPVTTPSDPAATPTAIYVSPSGSDAASGDKSAPKATLAAAVSSAIKANLKEVIVEDGTHYLAQPLLLGPSASGIFIHADSGTHPVVSGARPLSGLTWTTYKGNIMQASVSGAAFDQLFVNGAGQVRARYPNYQPGATVVFNGFASQAAIQARAAAWKSPAGGFLHSMMNAAWSDQNQNILGVNANGTLKLSSPIGNNRLSQGTDTSTEYVENIFEELDVPGEWFYNTQTATLYFYPPAGVDLKSAKFEGTALENLINIQGTEANPAQNIHIDGLTFTATSHTFMKTTEPLLRSDWTIYRSGAVLTEGASNIEISNNVFQGLGGNAIFVSGYNRNINIHTNEIYNIGASAIAFVGRPDAVRSSTAANAVPPMNYNTAANYASLDMTKGPKSNNYPSGSFASDNLIHDIGTKEKQVAGVEISMASKITVQHNSIYNTPRAGINIGDGTWGGHLIAYNDVFNTVLETGDHGAFNAWGRDRYWSPDSNAMTAEMLKNPTIWNLDAVDQTVIQNNRFRCDRGWDIDFDDGTSNYLVQNNVLLSGGKTIANDLKGGLKFREGFMRIGSNNIILNNSFYPQVWFAGSGDVFQHNIVMGAHQPAILSNFGKTVNSNLFMTNADLVASQNISPGSWETASAVGNPLFTSAATGDYSVPANSPAVTNIGFVSFATNQFGVQNAALKAKAQTPALPVLDFGGSATPTSDKTTLIGATIESITTVAQQSAAGLPTVQGVLVDAVQAGSPAATSGLLAGDAIIGSVAGGKSTPVNTVKDLINAYNAAGSSGSLTLTIYRNQQPMTLTLAFQIIYNDDWAGIAYTGGWKYSSNRNQASGDYNFDVHYTTTDGDSATITFTGTGIAVLGPTDVNAAVTATALLDGATTSSIAIPAAAKYTAQQPMITLSKLAAGTHTLKITKNSGIYLQIDAVTIDK